MISGSDDFNIYVWKIPEHGSDGEFIRLESDFPAVFSTRYFLVEVSVVSDAHMVLKGHRSIPNQVRFNPSNHLLLSSGVEKVIKVL